MSTPEPSPSTTPGPTPRPDWVAQGNTGERLNEAFKKAAESIAAIPASSPLTTGAFVSRAISTRFEVQPSRWGNLGTMVVLYGTFIGLPALGAVLAGIRIWHGLG
jgi:hypothetical protein